MAPDSSNLISALHDHKVTGKVERSSGPDEIQPVTMFSKVAGIN